MLVRGTEAAPRACRKTEGRFLKEDEAAANKRFNCYQARGA